MRVVCAGLATRDTIWRVPAHPAPDGRVVATEIATAGGGPAATAAVTLARLGIDVAFVGAVGDDDAGTFVLQSLALEGVDIAMLSVVPGARTPQSAILVGADGSRAIIHHPGDARFPDTPLTGDWIHVDHVGFGHVQRISPAMVSLDGGNPIEGFDLQGITVYAPTEERLRADFGDAQGAIDAGADLVVVTRGAEGSVATTQAGETVEVDGVPCDGLVSTLGAGDVFHGALLAYVMRGASLRDALRAANTAASLSCRALDARSAIPTFVELQRELERSPT
jgi:sugar/nucleoside kinase (ribokinase family)